MPQAREAPASFRSLKEEIVKRDLWFPARVENVARLCFDDPELLAFEATTVIARRAGVSRSTVLRFAILIGCSDIKSARRIFRDEIRIRSRERLEKGSTTYKLK